MTIENKKFADTYDRTLFILSKQIGEENAQQIIDNTLIGLYNFAKSKGVDKTYWDMLDDNPEEERLLTGLHRELNGNSILSSLGAYVRENTQLVERRLGLLGEDQITEPITPYTQGKPLVQKQRKNQARDEDTPFSTVFQMSDVDDRWRIPSTATTVHLSRASLLKKDIVEKILDENPGIDTIQISPSLERTHLGPGVKSILGSRGVKIETRRYNESSHYDESMVSDEHFRKHKFYQEKQNDTEATNLIENLKKYEFPHVELAEFLYGTERPMPMTRAVQEFQYKYHYIQRKVNALFVALGYDGEIRSKVIQNDASSLIKRVDSILRSETDSLFREELRRQCRVGEILPPKKLLVSKWPMWQKVCQYIVDNEWVFYDLEKKDPRAFDILTSYFMISNVSGDSETLATVAERYSISNSRIGQIKNQILQRWELLDDED